MQIISVVCSENCRGIPLMGWDSVKAALHAYSEGKARGARATTNQQLEAVEQSHDRMAVALSIFAGVLTGNPDAFLERMLQEAETEIRRNGYWNRSYDYDGQGNFFKTRVDIKLCDKQEDIYVLNVYAAYIGDEPENGLAEYLGIPRALLSKSVVITAEPLDASQFVFDFSAVYDGIGGLLGLDANVGRQITKHIMSGDQFDSPKGFLLMKDDGVRVTLSLGRVKRRFVQDEDRKIRDTWRRDGPFLIGLLDESYEDRSKKETPTFSITVSKKFNHDSQYDYTPVWDAELRQRITTLVDEISKGMMSV
jgi:hypothetical protein